MTSPISIITTTYNREQYLSPAIESILAQTYRNFELIIWIELMNWKNLEKLGYKCISLF